MQDFDEKFKLKPATPQMPRFFRQRYFFTIVSAVVFLACVSCCALSRFILGYSEFKGPDGADKVASEITEWAVPADFTGRGGVIFDNLAIRFDIAIYVQNEGRGTLLITQLHPKTTSFTEKRAMMQQFIDLLVPELKKLDLRDQESRTPTIRDAAAKFEIGHGEDAATTTKFRQVTGEFRGKLDDAVIILQCEEQFLSDQEIDKFISSIK